MAAMSRNPTIDRLRELPLFRGGRRDELALVARNVTEHHVAAGTVLMREGDVGREVAFIVEGTATVAVRGRCVARLGPGDVAGELALLEHAPRTATVVAETDLVLLVSGPAEFAVLVAQVPGFSRRLLASLAGRLRAAA